MVVPNESPSSHSCDLSTRSDLRTIMREFSRRGLEVACPLPVIASQDLEELGFRRAGRKFRSYRHVEPGIVLGDRVPDLDVEPPRPSPLFACREDYERKSCKTHVYRGRSSKRARHRTQSRLADFAPSSEQAGRAIMPPCRSEASRPLRGHRSRAGSLDLATRASGVDGASHRREHVGGFRRRQV